MKPEDKVITKYDFKEYSEGKANLKINEIWEDVISHLPHKLYLEAKEKGFILTQHIQEDSMAKYLMFEVPNCTNELKDELLHSYPFIIMFKD